VVIKGGGRVVKNVAGYDFPKLLTGSLGTLGIITQLTLKVRPIPEASALVWVPFTTLKSLAAALDQLNTSGTRPIALELLNGSAAITVGQALGLPTEPGVLVIGFEDNAGSIAWQLDQIKLELGRTNMVIVEGGATAPLWEALTEFQAIEPGPFSLVANVRPSTVAAFIARLDPKRWSVQAHAGNGIVRGHALGEWDQESAGEQVEELREAADSDGGNLIVSRCPTEWKDDLGVWGKPRADWSIAERVKTALDPHGALNPGRFVGRI
jgi:glycolate oxidase FAD binding subunit